MRRKDTLLVDEEMKIKAKKEEKEGEEKRKKKKKARNFFSIYVITVSIIFKRTGLLLMTYFLKV